LEHTLRELQLTELKLVEAVLDICEKHGLTIFMMGGTFLGAVRHQGFIPWDDDVDLGMSRDDYDTFLRVAPQELPEGYLLRHFATHPDMAYYPAQVVDPSFTILDTSAQKEKYRSAWIDLFPLDGMPKGRVRCFLHKYHLLYLRMMLKFSQFSEVVAVNLAHRPLHERILIALGKHLHLESRLDTGNCMEKIDHCLKKYPYGDAAQVVNFMGAYKFREMFPKAVYDSLSEYPFESLRLLAPSDYDRVLSQMYGDYMTPPPTDEQNKHGTVTAGKDNL
jgi:lipopolysaccharide cholinephosphotransferase